MSEEKSWTVAEIGAAKSCMWDMQDKMKPIIQSFSEYETLHRWRNRAGMTAKPVVECGVEAMKQYEWFIKRMVIYVPTEALEKELEKRKKEVPPKS